VKSIQHHWAHRSFTALPEVHMADVLLVLAEAALDRRPVSGWTHNFYL